MLAEGVSMYDQMPYVMPGEGLLAGTLQKKEKNWAVCGSLFQKTEAWNYEKRQQARYRTCKDTNVKKDHYYLALEVFTAKWLIQLLLSVFLSLTVTIVELLKSSN